VILCGAVIVEGPISHGRIDPVVWKAPNNRVAWTAICAVDVGIPVTLVSRIEQFPQARIANWKVGSDADRKTVAPMAFTNRESTQANRVRTMDFNLRDARGGRRFRFQVLYKCQQTFFCALEKNLDSLLAIQNPTCKRVGACQPIYKWTKANALHHAAHANGAGAGHSYSTSRKQLWPCQPI
jgi:hypothetical protein